jgi:hypothetical protein
MVKVVVFNISTTPNPDFVAELLNISAKYHVDKSFYRGMRIFKILFVSLRPIFRNQI